MTASQHPGPASLVKVTADPLDSALKEQLAVIARALGDPHRIEILHLLTLAAGPVCVIDLEHHLGLAQSTVSQVCRNPCGVSSIGALRHRPGVTLMG